MNSNFHVSESRLKPNPGDSLRTLVCRRRTVADDTTKTAGNDFVILRCHPLPYIGKDKDGSSKLEIVCEGFPFTKLARLSEKGCWSRPNQMTYVAFLPRALRASSRQRVRR